MNAEQRQTADDLWTKPTADLSRQSAETEGVRTPWSYRIAVTALSCSR